MPIVFSPSQVSDYQVTAVQKHHLFRKHAQLRQNKQRRRWWQQFTLNGASGTQSTTQLSGH